MAETALDLNVHMLLASIASSVGHFERQWRVHRQLTSPQSPAVHSVQSRPAVDMSVIIGHRRYR